MKKILMFAAVCSVLAACKKESSGTKPSLSFASYDPSVYFASTAAGVPQSGYNFNVTFNIADSDGDINDTLGIRAHYKSKDINNTLPDTTAWIYAQMPDIGANKGHSVKGQVTIALQSIDIIGFNPTSTNDSIWFSAYVRDAAGHFSDTVLTAKTAIIKE